MRSNGDMHPIISVHDVTPETLARVSSILDLLARLSIPPVDLLVVPGRDWDANGLNQLRKWQRRGHRLVAHGWVHQVDRLGGWRHWLHAKAISGDVAEHLVLSSSGIRTLMQRSAEWFEQHGFGVPSLYVPPAWALGALKAKDRRLLPFKRIEVLRGYLDVESGRLETAGLMGYEVDTLIRRALVLTWNRCQEWLSARRGRSLRLAIHPYDLELAARKTLLSDLSRLASAAATETD